MVRVPVSRSMTSVKECPKLRIWRNCAKSHPGAEALENRGWQRFWSSSVCKKRYNALAVSGAEG